jgi:hypothetical protein
VAARSGQQYHEFWGTFATRADLPNVAGAATQKSYLQVGDYAWVTQELVAFRCLNAAFGAAVWVAEPWDDSRRGIAPMIDDWVSLTPTGLLGWSIANSGGGASSQINNTAADADHLGIVESDTGNTTTGVAALYLGVDGIVTPAAGGLIVAETTVQFPALATVGEDYISRLLLGDSLVAADHTDGIYFEYNRSASVNWRCVTANGVPPGNRTATATGTVVAPATWYRLRAVITPGQALFFIDDALVANHVTNVPAGAAQRYAPNLRIQKTAGNAVRTHLIDYFQMRSVTALTR